MNNQSWSEQIKEINAQLRYERLLIISRELYKLIFNYTYKDYKWTSIEYNQMFKELNKLANEYDNRDWRDSDLLNDHYKTRHIIEKANKEWLDAQKGI